MPRGIAGRGDRRLLGIDSLAVDIRRRQDEGRRRADRCNFVVLDLAMHAEHEHVVARDLRIVGGEVAGEAAFVFVPFGFPVGLYRQMTAAAARCP